MAEKKVHAPKNVLLNRKLRLHHMLRQVQNEHADLSKVTTVEDANDEISRLRTELDQQERESFAKDQLRNCRTMVGAIHPNWQTYVPPADEKQVRANVLDALQPLRDMCQQLQSNDEWKGERSHIFCDDACHVSFWTKESVTQCDKCKTTEAQILDQRTLTPALILQLRECWYQTAKAQKFAQRQYEYEELQRQAQEMALNAISSATRGHDEPSNAMLKLLGVLFNSFVKDYAMKPN